MRERRDARRDAPCAGPPRARPARLFRERLAGLGPLRPSAWSRGRPGAACARDHRRLARFTFKVAGETHVVMVHCGRPQEEYDQTKGEGHERQRGASLVQAGGVRGRTAAGRAFGLFAGNASAIPPQANYVGEKICVKCHDVEAKHFSGTHARQGSSARIPRNELEGRVCEACHGPGSLHVPRDNHKIREYLIGFTREWGTPVEEQNASA